MSYFRLKHPSKFKLLLISATVAIGSIVNQPARAQLTPDDSLGEESSVVTPDVEVKGESADRIDGGAIRDRNLFHSFSEFNVGEAQRVYFANPDSIEQIFTRVTGSNPSNIDGTLGVDGAADLLLLNPNGIIFGENSSLDVEGSFFGTTADGVLFEDGEEFSASEPNSSLLTVSVPLGLQVGNSPGAIEVRSPLEVSNGQNFTLLGGDISLSDGNIVTDNGINAPENGITAPGGKVELGSLAASGIVEIEANGSLNFPQEISQADISLNNFVVDVSAGGGGSIAVNAKNLELFNSELVAGIDASVELTSGQAGDINIHTTEKVLLESSDDGFSGIGNITGDFSAFSDLESPPIINTQGNAGNITIETESLEAQNSFFIGSFTNGEGDAGNVNITATKSVNLLAIEPTSEYGSGILSLVAPLGTGDGANININTPSLTLSKSILATSTFGTGDAGNISINATEAVSILQSQLQAATASSGNAGNITVEAPQADILVEGPETTITTSILPPGEIDSRGFSGFSFGGTGKGGDISIASRNLSVTSGSEISTFTVGEVTADGLANAGNIELNIADSINISDNSALATDSAGEGNAGHLTVNTDKLTVRDSFISTATTSSGKAGNININASNFVNLSGNFVISDDIALVSLFTSTAGNADAGNITVKTQNLNITDGAGIQAATFEAGDGGNINIYAEAIELIGMSEEGFFSSILTSSFGSGTAGKIEVLTDNLAVRNRGFISAEAVADGDAGDINLNTEELRVENSFVTTVANTGQAGNLNIEASEFVNLSGTFIYMDGDIIPAGLFTSATDSDAGDLTVNTGELTIANGAQIQAATFSSGDGGNINVRANLVELTGNSGEDFPSAITAFTNGTGNGGTVSITTSNLTIKGEAGISVRSAGDGSAGSIFASIGDSLEVDNGSIASFSDRSSGGQISIDAGSISLKGDSNIRTNVENGIGGGGNITLSADSIVTFDDSDILANSADGKGGDITLNTDAFFAANYSSALTDTNPQLLDNNNRVDLSATGSVNGTIDIPEVNFLPNNLVKLSEETIDSEEVVANSCVVRSTQPGGTFIVTGSGGLPMRPADATVSDYATGTVRAIPEKETSEEDNRKLESIAEPEGVYRLANGKLVLSRECR